MAISPPLTVILPAHNAEATISQAIVSTLKQTYTDFELWVLENGSSDQTAEIARSFSDPRVKVFELGPVGFQGAIQYAIENAPSEWLARMDADDLMFPNRLASQMKVIKEHPELAFVGTAYALLTPFGHILERHLACPSRQVDLSKLGNGRFFADPSTIFNRRVALEVGGVDQEFTTGDVPLLFRMLRRGNGWEIAEPLYLYRIMPSSMSKTRDAQRQGLQVRIKYAPETAHYYRDREETKCNGWYSIAVLELLAGEGNAVRQAADFLRPEAPKTAHRLQWLSYLGKFGRLLYQRRHPTARTLVRRSDWEQLFEPLLALAGPDQACNNLAGIRWEVGPHQSQSWDEEDAQKTI
jgi:glycosyltransferase involved in cell wall biosynthesis